MKKTLAEELRSYANTLNEGTNADGADEVDAEIAKRVTIPAATLKKLTTLSVPSILRIHAKQLTGKDDGYVGFTYKSAEFVGITADGEFAYKVVWPDDSGTGDTDDLVFIKYDRGSLSAYALSDKYA